MKALSFLFTSLLGGLTTYAQSNLEQYYKNSIEAAVHICKGEYVAAKNSYKKAFSKVSVPFFIDINNAIYAEVNSETPDKALIWEYLLLLQKKGICIHAQYERFSILQPYLADISEYGCFSVEEKSAKTLIEDCIKRDQVLRKFSHEELSAHMAYDPTLLPAINRIDSVNYVLMDSLLHVAYKRGVNIENLVGWENANSITTILLHNEPWGRTNKPFWDSCIARGIVMATTRKEKLIPNGIQCNKPIRYLGYTALAALPSFATMLT